MSKIILSGYYGFGNSGDEAILKTIIEDLRSLKSDLDIVVLSKEPSKTSQQLGVKSVNRYNIFRVIRHISDCDLFISGGGSLLQDNTSTRSLFYYLTLIRIALFFRKKVMLYANGVGPLKRDSSKRKVKSVLDRVSVITLREEDSLSTLIEIGVKPSNMLVTADPVLNHSYADKGEVDDIFDKEEIPLEAEMVGFNVREWKNISGLEDAISGAADYLYEKYGLMALFINMSPSDRNVAERVRKKMKAPSCILKDQYNPEQLIGIIGRMKFVIAMRLHTLIYASIFSLPVIGLEYDPKVKGYLNYIKQTSIYDVESVKVCHLIKKIDQIMADYEAEKQKLAKMIGAMKLQSRRNAEIAVNLLENSKSNG
ncbi:MAG: polysaccharide pyruvyl transferase CsaB [Bacillota bacterium]